MSWARACHGPGRVTAQGVSRVTPWPRWGKRVMRVEPGWKPGLKPGLKNECKPQDLFREGVGGGGKRKVEAEGGHGPWGGMGDFKNKV